MSGTKLITNTNLLVASLPIKEYKTFLSLCDLVELHTGDNLGEAGKNFHAVYFPINCSISLVSKVDSRTTMETTIVGPEGMCGINTALDIKVSLLSSIVEASGTALSMDSNVFQKIHKKSTALQTIIKNYIFVRLAQLSQTASCYRFHAIEARLARWILMSQDCTNSREIYITHERLANKLGVKRGSVTQAVGDLQRSKLISGKNGRLLILDREKLKTITCDCYQLSKELYKKIMN